MSAPPPPPPTAAVAPKPKVRKLKIVSVRAAAETPKAAATNTVGIKSTPLVGKDAISQAANSVVTSATPNPAEGRHICYSPISAPPTAPRQQPLRHSPPFAPTGENGAFTPMPMMSPFSPPHQYVGGPWVPPMGLGVMQAQPWWHPSNNQQSVSPLRGKSSGQQSPKQRAMSPVKRASTATSGSQPAKPPQSNVIGSSVYIPQRNGLRIERSLEGASRDSLMQIIVELCFMSKSAAEYVESKAQLLGLCAPSTPSSAAAHSLLPSRHDTINEKTPLRSGASNTFSTPAVAPLDGASPLNATTMSNAATYGELSPRVDDVQTPYWKSTPHPVDTSVLAEDAQSPSTCPSTASPANTFEHGESSTASPLASRSSANTSVVTYTSPDQPPREPASRRAFNTEKVHPCLHIYGACRHPVSCPCALLPYNFCLSWLRGVCHAGESCTMVHRLPDNCSEQVRLIHTLQEDDSHKGNLRTSPALVSRIFDTTRRLMNERARANNMDLEVSPSSTEAPSPTSTRHSVSPKNGEEENSNVNNDATCPKRLESTLNSASETPHHSQKPLVAPDGAVVARTLDLNDQ